MLYVLIQIHNPWLSNNLQIRGFQFRFYRHKFLLFKETIWTYRLPLLDSKLAISTELFIFCFYVGPLDERVGEEGFLIDAILHNPGWNNLNFVRTWLCCKVLRFKFCSFVAILVYFGLFSNWKTYRCFTKCICLQILILYRMILLNHWSKIKTAIQFCIMILWTCSCWFRVVLH